METACERRLKGEDGSLRWYEEWELARLEDEDREHARDGVWIIAATEARSMQESVEQCVHTVLGKAMKKFKNKRWADIQIIVLETSGLTPIDLAARAVETFRPSDRELVDHFLLVDGEDVTEASLLMSTLSRTAEVDEESRLRHIIDSPISEARVHRFKESYLKGRWDIGAAEKISTRYGAFQRQDERNDPASFGFNTLFHKGPFVDGSNWGDLSGWGLAVEEERRLLKGLHTQLAKSASLTGQEMSMSVTPNPSEILGAADRMSGFLVEGGFRPGLVVVATHLEIDVLIALNDALTIPSWQLADDLRTNWILGKYKGNPVLHLNNQDLNGLYVLDVARFATLVQHDPVVDMNVLPISGAKAKQLLEERPDLDMDAYALRSMVHLTVYRSYNFEIHDRLAVWAARFSP